MATVTVPTTSTLPVAGGDIIAAPLNGWITNLRTFVEGNNIDENNVDYTNSDGIVVMGQAQTITGLKTFENTSAAAGGVRTAAIFSIDPASGTPADGDGVELLFNADDDEGNVATIGELEVIMTDTDNGDEDSEIKLKALVAGSAAEFMVAGTPADGAGRVVFNDGSADIDFRIETNNIANGFVVDAGLDTFAFGAAGADDKFVTISPPAASHTATNDTYALHVTAGGAQTIPSGTTALVASVAIEEPNITATGTVTNAATLYVKNAPTEGGSNYSLWVDDGAVKLDSTLAVVGVGTFTAQSVHTGGIQSGANIVSDTDSTDDLGTTSVRWSNVYTDSIGDSGQALAVKATTLSFDAASTIDTSGNNALSLDAGSAVLTLDGGTIESDASTLSFDAAATIDTSGNNNLTLNAGTGTVVVTAGDLTIFDDNNNADTSLSIGTSATEALVIQALNGGSDKTLEELRFTTKTASGTANHGKMSFYVDETNIGNINDGGITLESGMVLTGNVTGNASGTAATVTGGTQAAITVCANLVTVGTIGTGTWQGDVIASAYLDSDTAHLSGSQTFTGDKTFTGTVTVGVDGTGKDVKFFGDSPGAYMEWDESADQLRILGPSADATGSSGKLLLATAQTAVAANDVLGQIEFQAPLEAQDTDARAIAAAIKAIAQDTFTASVNATDLIFYTGHSEAATEKFRFTSQGELGVGGANYGSDGQVLTSGGAGVAPAWETPASSGLSYPLDMHVGAAMRVTVASSGSPTVFSLGWWKSSDGRWWLLGNATSATSFARADAEFYIPTGDINDVPSS
tara:strand:- start:1827 stop:4235 length:2409 start_codon:yes stop_codon:yes gene_type:complete